MIEDLKHYLALVAILSMGLGLFLLFNFNRWVQMEIVVIMSAAYVLWGMVTHFLKKDLHLRIIGEYLIVALLTVVFLFFLLIRA